MIMEPYYYSLSITIIDFIIVFGVELLFFLFITDKFHLKENSGTLLISSLLKVGFLSLLLSWIPINIDYSLKNVVFVSVLLLLSGVILDSIIFRKDLLLSKNESFDLGFKLSVLSSSAFFMVKILFMPDYYYPMYFATNGVYNEASISSSNGLSFLNFGSNFGILFLLVAFVLLLYRYSSKQKPNTTG